MPSGLSSPKTAVAAADPASERTSARHHYDSKTAVFIVTTVGSGCGSGYTQSSNSYPRENSGNTQNTYVWTESGYRHADC